MQLPVDHEFLTICQQILREDELYATEIHKDFLKAQTPIRRPQIQNEK